MAKGDSTKRGYMTLKEVRNHLGKIDTKDDATEAIIYLGRILQKKNLLSPKTKNSIYELLGESYETVSRFNHLGESGEQYNLREAEKYFFLAGKPERAKDLYEERLKYGKKLAEDDTNEYRDRSAGRDIVAFATERLKQVSAKKRLSGAGSLETSVAAPVVAVLAIGASIFFLNSSLAGNAIANLSNQTSSILGTCLLALGCISGLFYLKSKKKK
jgi:hypothetical protein